MSYELNEDQIEILAEAHAIRCDPDSGASEYLCCNIEQVLSRMYSLGHVSEISAVHEKSKAFQSAIQAAMKGHSSMFIYLRREVPGFLRLPIHAQYNFSNMAREAWLTKMIQTRKIA